MTFRRNRRKQVVMTQPMWIEVGGFLSCFAALAGAAATFLIPNMEPAIFVGTIPGWVYVIACGVHSEGSPL